VREFAQKGSLDFWSSHSVYRREPEGKNELFSAYTIERLGWGDCEDWSAFFCAWCAVHGVKAVPFAYVAAPGLLHVVAKIQTPKGTWAVIDPSRIKGMP
jgi:hypothetical protein